jgi:uncharacterized protein YbaP (TraB family)
MRRILAVLAAFIAIPASAQNLLWEVSSLTNKVYLFGTIHAGKLSWYPLPKAVEDALADSRELVVEADVTDLEAIEKAGGTMAYQPPDTLKYHVPAKDYERFLKLLPRYKLPESAVLQMKPLVATSLLVFAEWARRGYLPDYGVDVYLIKKARAELKPVVELEGAELQAKLMDSLSEAESRALFSGTLGALESGLTGEQIDAMVQAWQIGDSRAFLDVSRVYNEKVAGAAEFEDLFVWSRHEAMLKKIQGWLDGSRDHRFIAVGALHLVGPKGLVEMLRQRGYVVRQVFVAPTSPGASSPGEILPGAPSPGEKKNE